MTVGPITRRLEAHTLSVCRHYLSSGRRLGNYWVVGNVQNAPGRSMYVRLLPDGAGRPAGRWTDAATGEFGDLLDIIHHHIPSGLFIDAMAEAEAFLGELPVRPQQRFRAGNTFWSNRERLARELYQHCSGIAGTLAEDYLLNRGIEPDVATGVRFHPQCYCRPAHHSPVEAWPALIVPVTDNNAILTGIHRLYLDPRGNVDERLGKAPIHAPKRSLGPVRGHAARFGPPSPLIAVAEGVENALAVRTALPELTVHASLAASNLAAYIPAPDVQRLLIAFDNDDAGRWAANALKVRLRSSGLSIAHLAPRSDDHNADLRVMGLNRYRAYLESQLAE